MSKSYTRKRKKCVLSTQVWELQRETQNLLQDSFKMQFHKLIFSGLGNIDPLSRYVSKKLWCLEKRYIMCDWRA